MTSTRPPSVDALARALAAADAGAGLPHPLLVDVARTAIAGGGEVEAAAELAAAELRQALLTPVVNATGVLLHTNLGRAPLAHHQEARAQSIELDLVAGTRGSRQQAIGGLLARLCGAEAAMVVNNNAAAVLLAMAALAGGRSVAVSRGESVEIGGGFRVPEVLAQSGAHLVDVGTTNRTRRADYAGAVADHDVAVLLKVHPSNYRVDGFVEDTSVAELATIGPPVVVDLGSGLLDATCPWWPGPPPAWLRGEPAAVQTLGAGASLVTFSGDKLLGGPQAGILAGRRDLIERCTRHPLARALRPGGLVLSALHELALAYLRRDVCATVPFWRMAAAPVAELEQRAAAIAEARAGAEVVPTEAVPGAGSAPGATIPSRAVALAGDHLAALRRRPLPIIARARDGRTVVDLRAVDPVDDPALTTALTTLPP